jgi:hypothetical protein
VLLGLEIVEQQKRCSRCATIKVISEFGPCKGRTDRDGVQTYCRPCMRAYDKSRGPRIRTYEHHREKSLKRKYGITIDDYNRMFTEQGGVCAICSEAEAGNPYGVLEVEHDHATGVVRGLVCHPCNNAIMWYENWRDYPHADKVVGFMLRTEGKVSD